MTQVKRKPVNGREKGAKYERDLADYFVELGYENARRMIRTGTKKHADEGDLVGLPFTVQAKVQGRPVTDAQVAAWREDAQEQAATRRHACSLLVIKRNGHKTGKSWVYTDVLTTSYLAGTWHGAYVPFEQLLGLRATMVRLALDDAARLLTWRYPPR